MLIVLEQSLRVVYTLRKTPEVLLERDSGSGLFKEKVRLLYVLNLGTGSTVHYYSVVKLDQFPV